MDTLKKRELEKKTAVDEALDEKRKQERINQRMADKKRVEEDQNRAQKLAEVNKDRMM